MKLATRTGAVVTAAALTIALSACTASNETPTDTGSPAPSTSETAPAATVSGTLNAAGASSQESAMEAWRAAFQTANPELTINYDPVGSGGGRTQFLDGAVAFAGSDSALDEEEYELAVTRCGADGAINLPVYISPISVVFNLEGVTGLNMSAETIAGIFDGKITKWNDAAIAADNEGVELPDLAITTVHRADDSGTTKNFTDYLAKAAGGAWGYEADGVWPLSTGESGQGTSGLIQVVTDTAGSIGYADSSKAGALGTVAIKVGEEFVQHSPEGAGLALTSSELAPVNGANDLVYKVDRTTTAAGAYPLMLLSYAIVCQSYTDAAEAANVTGFLSYVASAEGQAVAASAAGAAALPAELSTQIVEILAGIAAASA